MGKIKSKIEELEAVYNELVALRDKIDKLIEAEEKELSDELGDVKYYLRKCWSELVAGDDLLAKALAVLDRDDEYGKDL